MMRRTRLFIGKSIAACILVWLASEAAYAADRDLDAQLYTMEQTVVNDRAEIGRIKKQMGAIAKEKAFISAAKVRGQDSCAAGKQARSGKCPSERSEVQQEIKRLEQIKKKLLKKKERLEQQLADEQNHGISHE